MFFVWSRSRRLSAIGAGSSGLMASLALAVLAWTVAGQQTAASEFSASFLFDDTDGIVEAGTNVAVGLEIRLDQLAEGETVTAARLDTFTVEGASRLSVVYARPEGRGLPELGFTSDADADDDERGLVGQELRAAEDTWADAEIGAVIVSANAQEGINVVRAMMTAVVNNAEGELLWRRVEAERAVQVGNAGEPVSTLSLRLGLREGFGTESTEDDVRESGIVAQDGEIRLELEVNNSLRNLANDRDVEVITLRGSGGLFEPPTITREAESVIVVSSQDARPRNLTVYALTFVGQEPVESNRLILRFTGPAASIELAEAPGTLFNSRTPLDDERDRIRLRLTALDERKNDATVPQTRATIRGPDGRHLWPGRIEVEQLQPDEQGRVFVELRSLAPPLAPLENGVYEIDVVYRWLMSSSMFIVAGPTAVMNMEVDPLRPEELGEEVLVTVELFDAEGDAVADGTLVQFVSGNPDVMAFVANEEGVLSHGGMAENRLVVYGRGPAVIIAHADGISVVKVVHSEVPPDQAPPEPEPELVGAERRGGAGLSVVRFGTVVTWEAENQTTAAELFDDLLSLGARAVRLWDGKRWVPYAAAPSGRLLPGAYNFTIATGDQLWLEN